MLSALCLFYVAVVVFKDGLLYDICTMKVVNKELSFFVLVSDRVQIQSSWNRFVGEWETTQGKHESPFLYYFNSSITRIPHTARSPKTTVVKLLSGYRMRGKDYCHRFIYFLSWLGAQHGNSPGCWLEFTNGQFQPNGHDIQSSVWLFKKIKSPKTYFIR